MMKNFTLGALLMAIAVLGPLVAYAGITVVYPKSNLSVAISTTPPIVFDQGADYNMSTNLTLASGWIGFNNNASFNITFNGLSGANVTVDRMVHVNATAFVDTWKLQVGTAYVASGLESNEINILKIRAWEGGTAPTADNDAAVCAYLDLEAAVDTESTQPGGNTCDDDVNLQFIIDLVDGANGSGTVSIRPSSITFVAG